MISAAIQNMVQYRRRATARRRLHPHLNSDSKFVRLVFEAIYDALCMKLDEQELYAVRCIEAQRRLLVGNKARIEITDFGAGKPKENRPRSVMDQGVQSESSISQVAKVSKSKLWGLVLFKLIRKFGPHTCVELGTCVGVSAAYQAKALELNGKGELITFEGAASVAGVARNTFSSLSLANINLVVGPFHETLVGTLKERAPIDFLFNDGHHDHDAVLDYFEKSYPYMSDPSIIVFDDIAWSPGMKMAWQTVRDDPRVSHSFDFGNVGLVRISKVEEAERLHFDLPL